MRSPVSFWFREEQRGAATIVRCYSFEIPLWAYKTQFLEDEADKYRAMFDEAMKLDSNSKNEDYQSFAREIEEAFG